MILFFLILHKLDCIDSALKYYIYNQLLRPIIMWPQFKASFLPVSGKKKNPPFWESGFRFMTLKICLTITIKNGWKIRSGYKVLRLTTIVIFSGFFPVSYNCIHLTHLTRILTTLTAIFTPATFNLIYLFCVWLCWVNPGLSLKVLRNLRNTSGRDLQGGKRGGKLEKENWTRMMLGARNCPLSLKSQ